MPRAPRTPPDVDDVQARLAAALASVSMTSLTPPENFLKLENACLFIMWLVSAHGSSHRVLRRFEKYGRWIRRLASAQDGLAVAIVHDSFRDGVSPTEHTLVPLLMTFGEIRGRLLMNAIPRPRTVFHAMSLVPPTLKADYVWWGLHDRNFKDSVGFWRQEVLDMADFLLGGLQPGQDLIRPQTAHRTQRDRKGATRAQVMVMILIRLKGATWRQMTMIMSPWDEKEIIEITGLAFKHLGEIGRRALDARRNNAWLTHGGRVRTFREATRRRGSLLHRLGVGEQDLESVDGVWGFGDLSGMDGVDRIDKRKVKGPVGFWGRKDILCNWRRGRDRAAFLTVTTMDGMTAHLTNVHTIGEAPSKREIVEESTLPGVVVTHNPETDLYTVGTGQVPQGCVRIPVFAGKGLADTTGAFRGPIGGGCNDDPGIISNATIDQSPFRALAEHSYALATVIGGLLLKETECDDVSATRRYGLSDVAHTAFLLCNIRHIWCPNQISQQFGITPPPLRLYLSAIPGVDFSKTPSL